MPEPPRGRMQGASW